MDPKTRARIDKQYRQNFFKSGDMQHLYEAYPDPWRLAIDGHDRYARILREIDERFLSGNPRLILDIGCGEGILSCMLGRRYVDTVVAGCDISSTAIERAEAHAKEYGLSQVLFAVVDIGKESLPIDDTKVDVIILGDVLYYLNSPTEVTQALAQVDRLLADQGIIILTEFPHTRKYVKLLSERFKLLQESREIVRYEKTPIDEIPGGKLSYRLTVFGR